MTFVGLVERLGIPGDNSTRDLPFVMFAFEDTLIFAVPPGTAAIPEALSTE